MDWNKRNSKNLNIFINFILFFLIFNNLVAQDVLGPGGIKLQESEKPINENNFAELGLYVNHMKLIHSDAYELGGKISINNSLFNYGFVFNSLLTHSIKLIDPTYTNSALFRLTYGGMHAGYLIKLGDFSFTPHTMIGLGNINASLSKDVDINLNASDYWIFILQPAIKINYNFLKEYAIGTELFYRFSFGAKLPGTTNCNLSGPGISLFISVKQFMK